MVLLGTGRGLIRGFDNGTVLTLEDAPRLTEHTVFDVVVDPQGGYVYTATDNGVYVSRDSGQTWTKRIEGFPTYFIDSLASLPSKASTLFAVHQGTLLRTEDAGSTWKRLDVEAHWLAICPGVPEQILATSGGVISRSSNGGSSWTREQVDGPSRIWYRGKHLYGFFESPTGGRSYLKRSENSGESWEELGIEIPPNLRVNSICEVSADSQKIYVCLGNEFGSIVSGRKPIAGRLTVPLRVPRTIDGGRTWLDVPDEDAYLPGVADECYARLVAGTPLEGHTFYAAAMWGFPIAPASVARSLDGGKTWEAFGDHSAIGRVESIAVSQVDDRVAFIGCLNGSVFMTKDAGQTWQPLAAGRTWGRVSDILLVEDSGSTLYLATAEGVYRRQLSSSASVVKSESTMVRTNLEADAGAVSGSESVSPFSVFGIVTDEEGRPLPGVRITASCGLAAPCHLSPGPGRSDRP